MGLESTTNQMMWLGESLLGYGVIHDPTEIEAKINAVQPEDIQRCACYCLHRGRLGVAVVGPLQERDRVESWLS
jgi:predicted Zn-dependent peptidase